MRTNRLSRWCWPLRAASLASWLAVAACPPRAGTAAPAHGAAALHVPPSRTPPVPTAEPPDPWQGALIVGSAEGLYRVLRDGSDKRVISGGPALYPRWLDDDGVVVLNPAREGELQHGARLERVSLQDGTRTLLAELPSFSCQKKGSENDAEDGFSVSVQSAEDFRLLRTARVACLQLMDRNTNMSNLTVEVEADLSTGKVLRALTFGKPGCKVPRDMRPRKDRKPGACDTIHEPVEKAHPAAYPFFAHFDDEHWFTEVRRVGENDAKLKLAGYSVIDEARSPSGRWLLLGGDEEDGDYLYRRLVLLDQSDGSLYPIPEKPGAWPAAVARVGQGAKDVATPVAGAVLAAGETELRWLRDGASEVLVVDSLVVRPELTVFALGEGASVAR